MATSAAQPSVEEPIAGARKWVLMASLFVAFFVFAAQYAAIVRVLLPNQVAAISPDDKVANLALITTFTAIGIALITPLSGALSDRTRSRWGKRSPFMIGGVLLGCGFIAAMPHGSTLWWLGACWVAGTFCLNAMDAPMTTIIADRFDPGSRGTASGFVGAGMTSGLTAGTIAAAFLVDDPIAGHAILAGSLALTTLLFVMINREPSSANMPIEQFNLGRFLRGFWLSPREHPDFVWAFAGRFFMFMGYTSVVGYTLYTLRDHVHLSDEESNAQIAVIFTIQLIASVFSGLLCGYLSDRTGRRKPFVFIASIGIAAAFMVPIVFPTLTGMYIYGAILGLGYGAYTAVDMALITDVLPKTRYESSGKNLGILTIAATLPQVFGFGSAATLLLSFGEDYRVLFGYGAVLVIASSFMVFPIRAVR